jgi:hypothetical protein
MKESEEVLAYALTDIKEDFKGIKTDLKEVRDCVVKMDKGMTEHLVRTTTLEKRVDILEPEVKDATSYMNKVAGALIIISLLIQLAGPVILDYLKPNHKPATSLVNHSSATIATGYVDNSTNSLTVKK